MSTFSKRCREAAPAARLEQRGDHADAAAVRFILKRVLKAGGATRRWRGNLKPPAGRLGALPTLEPIA